MIEIPIPLSLLYELADDSPLKGAWNMKSVPQKLEDLYGPGELLWPEWVGETLCLPLPEEIEDARTQVRDR